MGLTEETKGAFMEYTLQNIVLPDMRVCDKTEMYLRPNAKVQIFENKLLFEKNGTCEFSTYFNAFSLNKWREYTKLENLQIRLHLQGDFRIEVFSACWYKKGVAKDCLCVEEFHHKKPAEFCLAVPGTTGDNIYFTLTSLKKGGVFLGGSYSTMLDEDALNPVEIDLVMCTFKREPFIKRNIQLLKENFFDGTSYNAAGHFHIKVVDNGQTLDPKEIETADGSIRLYPNLNVGGAGGFSRGLIESLKEHKSTHVLFMDDDVLIQMEALERTYNLLRILKKDYQDAFLGGAMLRIDRKNIQHESLAAFFGSYIISLKSWLNLNNYQNVLFNEKSEHAKTAYCAWWYCCMPTSLLSLNNLPYPFFIRIDDMAFSIRNAKHCLSLNGISVWHAPFDAKYSTLMENYFAFRNNCVANTIHQNASSTFHVKFFLQRFFYEILRYDYGGAGLLLDGMERFLQGPKFFQTVDTVEDLKSHACKQGKMVPLNCLSDENVIYPVFKADISQKTKKENRIKKLLRFSTLNGHLLPDFLLKNSGYAEYGYTSNSQHYFRKKKVIGCDPLFENGIVLKMSRTKCFRLILRYISLNIKLLCNYGHLREEYKKSFPYMTSLEFWEKYLKLNPQS